MPASLTKRTLSTDEIECMLREGFGAQATISAIEEFTEGYFASVYGVRVVPAGGGEPLDVVLKVAVEPGPHLLRYETDLLSIEVEFFGRAAQGGALVPALRYVDPQHRFLVMDQLTGRSLSSVSESIAPPQLERVRRELGEICARLHTVTGELFGYPRPDGHTRSRSWRESFLTIVDDILADVADYTVMLPLPAAEIRARIERHAALLDQVDTPRLVHYDLWDGNVFVAADDNGDWHVTGLIDGERAFYGDPIAELVSLAIFAEPAEVPGVLDGMMGRALTADERTRLRLYNVYLLLIMVTEGAPRGWTHSEHRQRIEQISGRLAAELDLL